MTKTKSAKKQSKTVVAKEKDGSIQITFNIAWSVIEKKRNETAKELAKNITVDGFRKGKAPIEQVMKRVPQDQLTEKTLSKILPEMLSKILVEEKLRPAIYPKFELINAKENEDWQIRAKTCELPDIDVKEFKQIIKKVKIPKVKKGESQTIEVKQNAIIEALLKVYTAKLPEMLTEEEVNSRLASLLERLEKLGLSLESYLVSVNKTAEKLREEYGEQANKSIILDIILQEIAILDDIEVTESEIVKYLQMASGSEQNKEGFSDSQKNTIRLFLKKRKTLDHLVTLLE